jgi:hypothetical protein
MPDVSSEARAVAGHGYNPKNTEGNNPEDEKCSGA